MTESEVSHDGGIGGCTPTLSGDSSLDSHRGPRYSSVATNQSSSSFTYEELSNGFTCPTCQGSGKIPRGREDDLVALIPYNDERLKPRRTCLYVFMSIFACAAVAGILVYFFLPRSISVSQKGKVQTVGSGYNTTVPYLQLNLSIDFDIYNDNFVSINIQSITIQASWSDQVIGNNMTTLNDSLGGHHDQQFSANVTVTFTESVIVLHCTDTKVTTHSIYVQFMSTLQYQLMSQNQQVTLTFYKIVDCKPVDPHDIPG